MYENEIFITGNSQKSFAAGTQYADVLSPGVYDVWANADVYLKVSKTLASDVTTGTGYLLREGTTIPVLITEPSFIGAAGSGIVYFHKVK